MGTRGQEAREVNKVDVAIHAHRGWFADLHFISEVPVIPSCMSYLIGLKRDKINNVWCYWLKKMLLEFTSKSIHYYVVSFSELVH